MAGATAAAGVAGGGDLAKTGGAVGDGEADLAIRDTPAEANNHPQSVPEGQGDVQVKMIIIFGPSASSAMPQERRPPPSLPRGRVGGGAGWVRGQEPWHSAHRPNIS